MIRRALGRRRRPAVALHTPSGWQAACADSLAAAFTDYLLGPSPQPRIRINDSKEH